jgi:hypothetical protein
MFSLVFRDALSDHLDVRPGWTATIQRYMGHGTPSGKIAVETGVAYAQLHLEALLSRLRCSARAPPWGRLLSSLCSSTQIACHALPILWFYIWLATVSSEHVCAKGPAVFRKRCRCCPTRMQLWSFWKPYRSLDMTCGFESQYDSRSRAADNEVRMWPGGATRDNFAPLLRTRSLVLLWRLGSRVSKLTPSRPLCEEQMRSSPLESCNLRHQRQDFWYSATPRFPKQHVQ